MMVFLEPVEQFASFLADQRTIHSLIHWIPLEAGEAPGFTWQTKQLLPEPLVFVPSKMSQLNLLIPGSQ
jgi:hypothetical protein